MDLPLVSLTHYNGIDYGQGPESVQKRSGCTEPFIVSKLIARLMCAVESRKLDGVQLDLFIRACVCELDNSPTTRSIDTYMAAKASAMTTEHPDYGILASYLTISSLQKSTLGSFVETSRKEYNFVHARGHSYPMIADEIWAFICAHGDALDGMIDYSRDFLIDYFGVKTLQRGYLISINGEVVERPQHMWMRVALGVHQMDIKAATTPAQTRVLLESVHTTYDMLSQKLYIHATPTLFNACTQAAQLSSCFLLPIQEDSLYGIYTTLRDTAIISKCGGGVGISVQHIRAAGSYIYGTNGASNGLCPMLRVFNDTAMYCDQGGGKRKGSFAIYIEPWHGDIETFLQLKKNHGDEHQRARDLFYALWLPDLFMKRVYANETWSLMCPNECPGLPNVYGDAFVALYESYEREGKYMAQIPARELWFKILDAQMETGTPYLLYKDSANAKSNQQNVGTIQCSNLCAEIIEYSDDKETSVCNLATIGLPMMVDVDTKTVDYDKLHRVVKVIASNLDRVIDVNYYPTPNSRTSNMRHRPIGIGVQGLADMFLRLDLSFHSADAAEINRLVFETIYHAALERSCELAAEKGAYETFTGSPASRGQLQYDLWGVTPTPGRYDWAQLKADIQQHGLRNSLLVALPPTASTSQILGFNECFEPFTSNLYSRRVLSGEYTVINNYLVRDLISLQLWTPEMKNDIIQHQGSIQHITAIPAHMRAKYKTVWEIPMRHIIDMAADRGAFVCQSQSMNLWMADPTYNKLTAMHFYAWEKGLKTGIYYLRRTAKHQAQQFTIEPTVRTQPSTSIETEPKTGALNAIGSKAVGGNKDNNNDGDEDEDGDGECVMCSA